MRSETFCYFHHIDTILMQNTLQFGVAENLTTIVRVLEIIIANVLPHNTHVLRSSHSQRSTSVRLHVSLPQKLDSAASTGNSF